MVGFIAEGSFVQGAVSRGRFVTAASHKRTVLHRAVL